jgi:hypothetical protein
MREVSELPKAAQNILHFVEKHGLPMHFNPVIMGDLSIQEFEEVEAHLKKLPSSKAIRQTLDAINHTRLAGIGPWEGTLPPLNLPEKLETLIWQAAHRSESFGSAHDIQVMKSLTPEEATLLREGLQRKKFELLATGDPFEGELIDKSMGIAAEHIAPNTGIVAEHTVPKVAVVEPATVSSGYYSGSSLAGEAAKTEESWLARLSKEKWAGKKGLAVTGAVVGVGAVLYGTKKLLERDKASDNQPVR